MSDWQVYLMMFVVVGKKYYGCRTDSEIMREIDGGTKLLSLFFRSLFYQYVSSGRFLVN